MTAYEMRISDWSSDVCSSDLVVDHESDGQVSGQSPVHFHPLLRVGIQLRARHRVGSGSVVAHARRIRRLAAGQPGKQKKKDRRSRAHEPAHRSEEHTSELQSLMRISYAVFCLKKKKK